MNKCSDCFHCKTRVVKTENSEEDELIKSDKNLKKMADKVCSLLGYARLLYCKKDGFVPKSSIWIAIRPSPHTVDELIRRKTEDCPEWEGE